MSSPVRTFALFAALAAALLAACGDSEPKEPVVPAAEIVSFQATPDSIEVGQTSTLSWETRNAAKVVIRDALGAAISNEALPVSGSIEVQPGDTATFTLEAANEAGTKVTREVAVEVTPLPAIASITRFEATPAAVAPGDETTLSWATSGADEIAIVDGRGRVIDLAGAATAAGSVSVRVERDATFTLTAKNRGGAITATAGVDVVPPPTATLSMPSAPIVPGSNATISWFTTDTERVVLTDVAGTVLVDATDRPSGDVTVTANASATYTLRATGIGGEIVRTAELRVRPVIESFVVVTEGPVRSGDEVTVSWAVRGATAARLSNNAGEAIEIAAGDLQAGTRALRVGPDGALFLRVTSGSLDATAAASIAMTTAPRFGLFTADAPEVSARPDLPATVTISYLVDGAERLQIVAEPGGLLPMVGLSNRSGTVQVEITESTTFSALAINSSGNAESTTQVAVVPAPTIASFRANPIRVGAGEGVPLSWDVADATAIRIERDGVDIGVDPALVSGAAEDPIFADASYVLKAYNRLGFEVASAPVAVSVGDPLIGAFEVDRPIIPAGQQLTFSWTNVGGRTLNLLDSDGAVAFTTTDVDLIASGSAAVTAPILDATHDYTLQVINGVGGTSTEVLPVVVIGGPLVRSFSASTAGLSLGEQVTFTWQVDNDAQGRTPTVAITDDLGNAYDLGTADPNNGTATLSPVAAGATSFTLTATTPDTTASSANAPVVVYGLPTIDTLGANPEVVDTLGGTQPAVSTVAWTTQWGTELEIFEMVGGNPGATPVHSTVSVADIASGSTQLQLQPGSNDFLVVVTNGAGATVQGTVSIFVDPAEVLSFAAAPNQILLGESTQLAWTTNRATSVSLDPPMPSVTVGTEPLLAIDTTGAGTAARVMPSSDDGGYAAINFPSGFTFPWYGSSKSGLRVMTDGYISFNMSATSTYTNYELPRTGSSNIHLAAFWDDLHVRGTGELWWDTGSDAEGNYLVVMWKNFQFFTSGDNPTSMDMQIILRANGVVEYRYGNMGSLNVARVNGSSATIGLQNETGTVGYTYSYNSEIAGGLAGKSLRFGFDMPLSGTWSVIPRSTTNFTLTASNWHSSGTAQTLVEVFPPVSVVAGFEPVEPQAGTPFSITWTTTNATDVRVIDGQGVERCVALPNELASGSCSLTETAVGPYSYTVRAVGQIARDVQEAPVAVQVYSPLSIDLFAAAPDSIAVGATSTLTWQTTGASGIQLTANGVPVDLTGKSMVSDSIVVGPASSTEYVLSITDTGRTRSSSQTVNVRTASVSSFTASAGQVPAGSSVTLDWSSSGATGAWVSGAMPAAPATEVSATVAYNDVSTTGTAAARSLTLSSNTGYADFDLPAGFQFPYFGDAYGKVRIFAYGYLSFFPDADATSSNNSLPYSGGNSGVMVHLAPFHDSLSAQSTGSIWVDEGSDASGRYVVIQWKNFQFSSSTYNASDLNFQIVLRDDGTFEYRYGTMSGNGSTSYDKYADGSSATIGFQSVFAQQGHTVSHNPSAPAQLDNRAWRFDLRQPATGSMITTPTQTTTYRVCNSNLGYTECRETTVVVVKAGDLQVSELMVTPSADPVGEWIEVRNAAPYAIDIAGFTLTSGTESATIGSGTPLVVQPGSFAVLSRTGGPAGATWDYGTALTLDPVDSVAISYGTLELDSVAWDSATWTIPSNATIRLDPTGFRRQTANNDAPAAWCLSAELYDGTNAGTPGTLGAGCLSTTYDIDSAAAPSFIDITSTGTRLFDIDANSTYEQIPGGLGFAFPLFGDVIAAGTPITVTSSGMFTFAAATNGYTTNANIPTSGTPNASIAPFWDNLYVQNFATAHYEHTTIGSQQVLIVQWNNMRESTSAGGGRITFQAQVWENGDVVFAYREVEGPVLYFGTSATIGLENVGGTAAAVYSYGTSTSGTEKIWANQTIHFHKK